MLKNILILIITVIVVTGCEQKKATQIQPGTAVNNNDFFPVTQYLLGQIAGLDSVPLTPLKITTINGSADSVWMKKKDINAFLAPFILPVIDSATLHSFFSESSFLDQTLNAITLSYDPVGQLPDSMQIKHWDIYIDPAYKTVKQIYIVKQLNNYASSQTIQLTWKSDHYCQITTITEKKGVAPAVKQEKLIWNFNE